MNQELDLCIKHLQGTDSFEGCFGNVMFLQQGIPT